MTFNPKIKLTFKFPVGREALLLRSATRGRNDITLVLANTGSDPLTLTANSTSLSVDLSKLCDHGDLAEASLTAPGWTAIAGPNGPVLTPASDIAWGAAGSADDALSFALSFGRLGVNSKLGMKSVQAVLKNIRRGADTSPSKALDGYLILADKPETPDPKRMLSNALSFEIAAGRVFTSVGRDYLIPNALTVIIRNRDKDKPLLATRSASSMPRFTLVFPIASVQPGEEATLTGVTALTTAALAQDIEVQPVSHADYGWTAVGPNADSLVCELTPSAKNLGLIGNGNLAGALELRVSDLNTNLPPFATELYLLYEGIDGYDPGYAVLPLYRQIPEPQVLSFTAEPASIFCGDESVLRWSVLGCDRIELSYVEYGKTNRLSSDGDDASLGFPAGAMTVLPYEDHMVYILSLYKDGNLVKQQRADIEVVLPVMEFHMDPPAAVLGERSLLSWELSGKWAFEGKITEGRTVVQKISKPATDVPLRGAIPEEVRQNRFYHLSGTWQTPHMPLTWTREATLTVVEPVTSINYFRMYKTFDGPFGDISVAWSAKNAQSYMIGHCAAGTFPGIEALNPTFSEKTTIFSVFTMINLEMGHMNGGRENIAFRDLNFSFDDVQDTVEWCNERLAERDFFLLAFDDQGTSAVPVIQPATLVDRSQDL